tara:strand:+ start:4076 stop:4330 length:255 start_codon:yes stop_codon:yes gene_type:complete
MARNIYEGHNFDSHIKSIQKINSGSTPITISSVDLDKTILYTQRHASMNSMPMYLSNSTTLSTLDADNSMGTSTESYVIIVEYY